MIPFAPPRIDDKIIAAVTETLKSGWITTGPRTKQFEREITDYCKCKATLCLNSATAGLEIMLRWLGVGEGDEVILPAYTYSATANVVMHVGATPVFVDVNADDFNINIANIHRIISISIITRKICAGYRERISRIRRIRNSTINTAISFNTDSSGRDRKSTRLNSSHVSESRMPSSA